MEKYMNRQGKIWSREAISMLWRDTIPAYKMKRSFRSHTEGQVLPAFAWESMSRQLRILQMLSAVRRWENLWKGIYFPTEQQPI